MYVLFALFIVYLGTVWSGPAVSARAVAGAAARGACIVPQCSGAQVSGGAVERAARRGATALRGGGWQRATRRDFPVSAGRRCMAPAGACRFGRAGHAAR